MIYLVANVAYKLVSAMFVYFARLGRGVEFKVEVPFASYVSSHMFRRE